MTGVLQALRDEHAELLPHIEQLREAADRVSTTTAPGGDLTVGLEFLDHHLVPHAMAEDEVLYPEVARALGSPRATDTMRRDHEAVVDLIGQLRALRQAVGSGPPSEDQVRSARRILYGLHTLVSIHFVKEEEIYVPILEEVLSREAAANLYEAMERAAAAARRRT